MLFKYSIFLWSLSQLFNDTALIIAVYHNQTEIVQLLLEHEGIDVNIKDILIQNH